MQNSRWGMTLKRTILPGVFAGVLGLLLLWGAASGEAGFLSMATAMAIVLLWFFPSVAYVLFFSLLPAQVFLGVGEGMTGHVFFWGLSHAFAYYVSLVLDRGGLSVSFTVSATSHVLLTFPLWGFMLFLAGLSIPEILQGITTGFAVSWILPGLLFVVSWIHFFLLFRFRKMLVPPLAFPLMSLPFAVSSLACRLAAGFLPGPPPPS